MTRVLSIRENRVWDKKKFQEKKLAKLIERNKKTRGL